MAFVSSSSSSSRSRRCCSNPRAAGSLYAARKEELLDFGRNRSVSRERSRTSARDRPFIGCGEGVARRRTTCHLEEVYRHGAQRGGGEALSRCGSASERLARKGGAAGYTMGESRDAHRYGLGRETGPSGYSWLQSQSQTSCQEKIQGNWSLAAFSLLPNRSVASYEHLSSADRSRRAASPSHRLRHVHDNSSVSSSANLGSLGLNNEAHKRITSGCAESHASRVTHATVRGLAGRIGSLDVGYTSPQTSHASLGADSRNRSWYKNSGELQSGLEQMGSADSLVGSGQEFHSSLKQYKRGFLDRVQRNSRVFPLEPQPPAIHEERSHKRKAVELGVGPGTCGLLNLGNTCYQNATIQILSGIPQLASFFHTSEEWKKGSKASKEFGLLLNELWSKPHAAVVKCDSFHTEMGKIDKRWGRGSQEDANEFLVAILGVLQDDCNRNTSKPKYKCLENRQDLATQAEESWEYSRQWHNSIIDDIFGFQLQSELTCSSCHWKSNTFDYTTELEMPIPERSQTTLERCLISFSAPEVLSSDNQWYCTKCKKHVRATKKLSLFRMPDILLVTLKRFSGEASHALKNTSPILLDDKDMSFSTILSPSSNEVHATYALCGVVDHSGSTTSGHYTARVKNPKSKRWYHFNDCDVREVASPSGYESSVYTLVFQRS